MSGTPGVCGYTTNGMVWYAPGACNNLDDTRLLLDRCKNKKLYDVPARYSALAEICGPRQEMVALPARKIRRCCCAAAVRGLLPTASYYLQHSFGSRSKPLRGEIYVERYRCRMHKRHGDV